MHYTDNTRSKDLGLGFGLVLVKKCYFKLDFFCNYEQSANNDLITCNVLSSSSAQVPVESLGTFHKFLSVFLMQIFKGSIKHFHSVPLTHKITAFKSYLDLFQQYLGNQSNHKYFKSPKYSNIQNPCHIPLPKYICLQVNLSKSNFRQRIMVSNLGLTEDFFFLSDPPPPILRLLISSLCVHFILCSCCLLHFFTPILATLH